jgi:hypothetical protein
MAMTTPGRQGIMQLADIDGQDASTLVCDLLICRHCAFIDRDHDRIRKGSTCSTCGKQSEGGRLAFPISIHILVDLVQQAYHSTAPVGPISGPQVPSIGTILLFCTLREALLNWFLIGRLRAQNVPAAIVEKLLADNRLANQRFGELFKSVVECRWDEAVSNASRHVSGDFSSVSELMREAAVIRNTFLHEGLGWQATPEVAKACVNAMPLLVSLFATLHNLYVHPLQQRN